MKEELLCLVPCSHTCCCIVCEYWLTRMCVSVWPEHDVCVLHNACPPLYPRRVSAFKRGVSFSFFLSSTLLSWLSYDISPPPTVWRGGGGGGAVGLAWALAGGTLHTHTHEQSLCGGKFEHGPLGTSLRDWGVYYPRSPQIITITWDSSTCQHVPTF